MTNFPFIFMHGQKSIILTPKQRDNLGEYMKRGGFLFVDDCVLQPHGVGDAFYRSMVKEMKQILPDARWELLDKKHEIFHNVYNLPNGLPHTQGVNHGLSAIYHKDRIVALICSSDLHCGWVNVGWFSARVEREATKIGVNIYAYAMTH